MYENLEQDLRKKGWSDTDIEKTLRIFDEATKDKSPKAIFLDKTVYWSALILVIVGNIVLAVVLLPILIAARDMSLYTIIFIFGLFFGLLYRILIKDIEELSEKPLIILSLFLPTIALIVMYIIARLGHQVALFVNLPLPFEAPIIVSFVYVFGFMLPYFLYKL